MLCGWLGRVSVDPGWHSTMFPDPRGKEHLLSYQERHQCPDMQAHPFSVILKLKDASKCSSLGALESGWK